jgi:cytochrome c-type biogenesis protein
MKSLFKLILILFVSFITFNSCSDNSQKSNSKIYVIDGVIQNSEFQFVDFTFIKDGKSTKFSEFVKNKPVFLNFWGTWCPPCRKEIPDIIEISKENKDNLIVTGIALERSDNIEGRKSSVFEYASSNGIDYVNFIIDPKIERDLIMAYGGINAVPTTYMLSSDGKLDEKIVGMRSKEQFMQFINPLISR